MTLEQIFDTVDQFLKQHSEDLKNGEDGSLSIIGCYYRKDMEPNSKGFILDTGDTNHAFLDVVDHVNLKDSMGDTTTDKIAKAMKMINPTTEVENKF